MPTKLRGTCLAACLIMAGLGLPARAQASSPTTPSNAREVVIPQPLNTAPAVAPKLNWKPLDYYDLTIPGPNAIPYAEIWADKIAANNRAYRRKGDTRFAVGNAPATESDAGEIGPDAQVIVTTLNTFSCKIILSDPAGHATLKRCPMRLVEYVHGERRMFNAPDGCYLEFTPAASGKPLDTTRDATYAAYDPSDRSFHIGTVINHHPVAGCDFHIKLPQYHPDPPMMSRGTIDLPLEDKPK